MVVVGGFRLYQTAEPIRQAESWAGRIERDAPGWRITPRPLTDFSGIDPEASGSRRVQARKGLTRTALFGRGFQDPSCRDRLGRYSFLSAGLVRSSTNFSGSGKAGARCRRIFRARKRLTASGLWWMPAARRWAAWPLKQPMC
uniref:Uncharacterized protein n=1 Tax=mine drainage metagenome TaxID=410659 RepID=E6PYD7_9ZZZZ